MNILDKIQCQLTFLSKSERKVAEAILAAPQEAIHSSIATLARRAGVSEPTVNRFCRHLETKGFPDFKLYLAQDLAQGTAYVNRHINASDSIESCTNKIFESAIAGLAYVHQGLNTAMVSLAVDLLSQARRIAFFGQGFSASVAHDAMNKFLRFNIPVINSDDIVVQRMSCMNCHEQDVVVLISHTGRAQHLVQLARLARENNASVLAITSGDSPLSHEATFSLLVDVPENSDADMPTVSHLAQLTVIDVLATGFILRREAKFRANLKRVTEALNASGFDH